MTTTSILNGVERKKAKFYFKKSVRNEKNVMFFFSSFSEQTTEFLALGRYVDVHRQGMKK
jgi:hypothetical protein